MSDVPSSSIGIVGFGRMGRAIAARLAVSRYRVLAWSRSGVDAAIARDIGATTCDDIRDLVAQADMILISVLDDAAVVDVLEQVCGNDLTGKLIVEMSTVRPETLRQRLNKLSAQGARAIDAPVSGGPDLIAAGEAGLYIGGDERDVRRFMLVAAQLSNRIVHVGEIGAGYAAKIVNNMMLAGFWQTLKESLQVGIAAGLTMETMVDILSNSPAANAAFRHRATVILGNSDEVGFSVLGAIKDVELFAEFARASNVDTPALAAALESFQVCRDEGHGDRDLAVMVRQACTPQDN